MLGVRIGRILRLEVLVADLIVRHGSFADVVDAFDLRVAGARGDGYIALKSIAAYRTGLAIEAVTPEAAQGAFEPVRREAEERGSLRLTSKPLIDFFVLRALHHAAAAEMPVQFHTGYGDPDLDLRLANPLHLRPIFEDPTLASAPIVMLHESYPYTAEAAYLAVSYPNAYLDIAYTLPPLDRLELHRVTGVALGAAPASKIMVSSDGVGIPEQYWLGAIRARDAVGRVLGAMVEADELSSEVAATMGRMILHDNAVRLYGLT
jgi:predicted TIM-barrel fold metal-dependent hydrolase